MDDNNQMLQTPMQRGILNAAANSVFAFPLTLPHGRVLQARKTQVKRHLVGLSLSFWLLMIAAAGLFLGVWFMGHSGGHLSSTEQRAAFQVVGLYPDGVPINPAELRYCSQNRSGAPYICRIGSASEIVYPDSSSGNIFVVTRVTLRDEQRLCGVEAPTCTTPVWTNLTSENISYWASPETMRIRVGHATLLRDARYSNIDMYGDIVDEWGNVLQTFNHSANNINLGTFLRAAGIDLDNQSDMNAYLYRYNGLILNAVVEYSNWESFSRPKKVPHFRYRVYHVPKTEYRVIAPAPGGNNTHRILDHRRGVLLHFTATGKYYEYNSFNVFLVVLSTFFILGDILALWYCFLSSAYQVEDSTYHVDVQSAGGDN